MGNVSSTRWPKGWGLTRLGAGPCPRWSPPLLADRLPFSFLLTRELVLATARQSRQVVKFPTKCLRQIRHCMCPVPLSSGVREKQVLQALRFCPRGSSALAASSRLSHPLHSHWSGLIGVRSIFMTPGVGVGERESGSRCRRMHDRLYIPPQCGSFHTSLTGIRRVTLMSHPHSAGQDSKTASEQRRRSSNEEQ